MNSNSRQKVGRDRRVRRGSSAREGFGGPSGPALLRNLLGPRLHWRLMPLLAALGANSVACGSMNKGLEDWRDDSEETLKPNRCTALSRSVMFAAVLISI